METEIKQEPLDDWQYPALQQQQGQGIQQAEWQTYYPNQGDNSVDQSDHSGRPEPGEIMRASTSHDQMKRGGGSWFDPAGRCVAQTEVAWNPQQNTFGMLDQLAVSMLQEQGGSGEQVPFAGIPPQMQDRVQGWPYSAPNLPQTSLGKDSMTGEDKHKDHMNQWEKLFQMHAPHLVSKDGPNNMHLEVEEITSYNGNLWGDGQQAEGFDGTLPYALYGHAPGQGERPAKKQRGGKRPRQSNRSRNRNNNSKSGAKKPRLEQSKKSMPKQAKNTKPLKCGHPKCRFSTKDPVKMKLHLKFHIPSEYKCKKCKYLAPTRKDLLRHTNKHRLTKPGTKTFKCLHCSLCTTSVHTLKLHVQLRHKKAQLRIQKLGCGQCDFVTPFHSSYRRHMTCHEGFENAEPVLMGVDFESFSDVSESDASEPENDVNVQLDTNRKKKKVPTATLR